MRLVIGKHTARSAARRSLRHPRALADTGMKRFPLATFALLLSAHARARGMARSTPWLRIELWLEPNGMSCSSRMAALVVCAPGRFGAASNRDIVSHSRRADCMTTLIKARPAGSFCGTWRPPSACDPDACPETTAARHLRPASANGPLHPGIGRLHQVDIWLPRSAVSAKTLIFVCRRAPAPDHSCGEKAACADLLRESSAARRHFKAFPCRLRHYHRPFHENTPRLADLHPPARCTHWRSRCRQTRDHATLYDPVRGMFPALPLREGQCPNALAGPVGAIAMSSAGHAPTDRRTRARLSRARRRSCRVGHYSSSWAISGFPRGWLAQPASRAGRLAKLDECQVASDWDIRACAGISSSRSGPPGTFFYVCWMPSGICELQGHCATPRRRKGLSPDLLCFSRRSGVEIHTVIGKDSSTSRPFGRRFCMARVFSPRIACPSNG